MFKSSILEIQTDLLSLFTLFIGQIAKKVLSKLPSIVNGDKRALSNTIVYYSSI